MIHKYMVIFSNVSTVGAYNVTVEQCKEIESHYI